MQWSVLDADKFPHSKLPHRAFKAAVPFSFRQDEIHRRQRRQVILLECINHRNIQTTKSYFVTALVNTGCLSQVSYCLIGIVFYNYYFNANIMILWAVTSCGLVGSVLSYHIGNIANYTVCCRGDSEIHQQMNMECELWSDRGCDRRLCVSGSGYFKPV
jgi:hypothetical protein